MHVSDMSTRQAALYTLYFIIYTATRQAALWSFELSGFGFSALPHILQRVYAARDVHSLKLAWTVMACGCWIVQVQSREQEAHGME